MEKKGRTEEREEEGKKESIAIEFEFMIFIGDIYVGYSNTSKVKYL